jgi:hypothetical protein
MYIMQYLLPHDMTSPYLLHKKSAEGIINLRVEMHPLRKQPTIQRFLLSEENKAVGVIGVWHHGIEELFFAQKVQSQTLFRSLRHCNDDIIERGLYWLCTNILSWHDSDYFCPKIL